MLSKPINVADYERWLRLVTAIHFGGKELCRIIFHKQEQFPTDCKKLYNKLQGHKNAIEGKLKRNVITQKEFLLIFPSNGETDSNKFDIKLFTFLLQELFGTKYIGFIDRLRNWRNEIFHEGEVTLTENEFELKWNGVINLLLCFGFDTRKIKDLEKCPLGSSSKYGHSLLHAKKEELEDLFFDTLCPEVWEVMLDNTDFLLVDWEELARLVGCQLHSQLNSEYDIIYSDGEEKRLIRDQIHKENVSWKKLKSSLQRMKKADLIKEICDKTNLTIGVGEALRKYKSRLKIETSRQNTHTQYVDLVVAGSDVTDPRWKENMDEKDFMAIRFNVPQQDFKNIEIDELITKEDDVAIVNGIPGIGKTTMCEEIKYRWSNNKIWTGEKETLKIDLLLVIPCRNIKMFNFSSTSDLIEVLFPELKDVELLKDISNRVLLLLDGADELQGIEQISKDSNQPLVQFFKDAINYPNQEFFSKLIITSRPKIAGLLRYFCTKEMKFPIRPVEVCGFNPQNIRSFVEKTFEDDTKVEEMLKKIQETSTTAAMCSVPIFLNSFCMVFKEDSKIKTPSTMTELLLFTLLTFFKELYKLHGEHQKLNCPLKKLATDKEVVQHIINLAQLSYKTLAEKKVVFFEEDFDTNILDQLEKIGFLSKTEHYVEGFWYEYRHLTLQELLTSIHILSADSKMKHESYKNSYFQDAMPLVSGLEGILKSSNVPRYLKSLVQNVTKNISIDNCDVKKHFEEQILETYNKNGNKEFQTLFDTYVFAQVEYLEFATEKFINDVLSDYEFNLHERNIENGRDIKNERKQIFLSFTLPRIKSLSKVHLTISHKSDNMEKLVNISRKANSLNLNIHTDGIKTFEYLEKLSSSSGNIKSITVATNDKISTITDIHLRFLCNIEELSLFKGTLLVLQGLKSLFISKKPMLLERLSIEHVKTDEIHVIGKLFQYVSTISLAGLCSESDLEIICQYINKTNKLKQLQLPWFPKLSFSQMDCLEEVTVLFQNGAETLHIYKELKSLIESTNNERKLKYINLEYFHEKRENKKVKQFIESIKFIPNVSTGRKDEYDIIKISL